MTDQEVDDRVSIRELLLRYARGVDSRDLGLVASCFTPDAGYRGALAEGTIADRLVTADGCYVPGQSWIARHLLSRDRGGHVRTEEVYRRLAARHFGSVVCDIRFDTARLPYTMIYLVCTA
jgi:hypothetical protein